MISNRTHILILQHPQEARQILGTGLWATELLERSSLRVGLSWKNLSKAVGENVDPKKWAVLYLGSPKKNSSRKPISFWERDQEIPAPPLDGVIVLDGNWSQAKTLWWRNSWLTRLKRIVLKPRERSPYRALRRAPQA